MHRDSVYSMQGLVREQQRVESVLPGGISDDGLIKVSCRWDTCFVVDPEPAFMRMQHAPAVELNMRMFGRCFCISLFVLRAFAFINRALEDRMRDYDMLDLRSFYLSKEFQKAHFQLDPGAGLITVRRA